MMTNTTKKNLTWFTLMSLASQNYKTNDQLIIERKIIMKQRNQEKKQKWSWKLGAKNEIQPKDHETKGPIAKDKRRLKAKDPRMKNKSKLKNTKEPKVGSKEDWQTQRSPE